MIQCNCKVTSSLGMFTIYTNNRLLKRIKCLFAIATPQNLVSQLVFQVFRVRLACEK